MAAINSGITPPDFNTPVGMVRLLLGDTDTEPIPVLQGQEADDTVGEYAYFSDAELTAILGLYGDNIKRAAARCWDTIASSEALLKKFVSADLSNDGPAVARELRNTAAGLRAEADTDDLNGGGSEFFVTTPTGSERHFTYGHVPTYNELIADGVVPPTGYVY